MRESGIRYAVKVFCRDGRTFLAHSDGLACKMFFHHKKAVQWKNGLEAELNRCSTRKTKCKVVKVRYTVEEVEGTT